MAADLRAQRHELDLVLGSSCPVCGGEAVLVTPDCADGHGAECPDRLCVACGLALFVDPPMRHGAYEHTGCVDSTVRVVRARRTA